VKPFLVVNPHSAGGWTGRHFDRILRAVQASIGEAEWAFTLRAGDGARLAREAYGLGHRFLVSVGGDGTASEVVDGLLQAGGAGDPALELGIVPRGTGGDLRRTLGLPDDPTAAARGLAHPATRRLDVGRVELVGRDGAPLVRAFANVATCGVSAVVAANVNAGRKLGSGTLTFFVASARAMLSWRDRAVAFRIDGGPWREERITALSVANGRFFGGGIQVAPMARPDDGVLDVVIWKGYGPVDLVVQRPKLYDGRHVGLPKTEVARAREIELRPADDGPPLLLDLDGEQPGCLPARITVLPGALRVRAGPPP
jgi:diacylglycerol kinase (ATP)